MEQNKQPYTYILLRKDISPEQRVVQASHAALEAGFRFPRPSEVSYLIVLEVANQEELLDAAQVLDDKGIEYYKFFEPDNNMGFSALCTRPLFTNRERNIFKQWKLFKM